jgi:hypothetical protein
MPTFKALSQIKHGVADSSGEQVDVRVFEVGDKVEGLDKKSMKALWDAGVLEQVDEVASKKDTVAATKSNGDAKVDAEGSKTPPTE